MFFVHIETDGRLLMSIDTFIEKLVNVHGCMFYFHIETG